VTLAGLVVVLQGALLAVLGLGYGVAGVVGEPADRLGALLEGGMALVAGVLIVLVGRGLVRRASWARSPAVVLELLCLPVGVGLVQGQVWFAAVPVLGLAAVVLYLLLTPEARLELSDRG